MFSEVYILHLKLFYVSTFLLIKLTITGIVSGLVYGSNNFVIPPNSNTFSDWRRTCHVSLVKTS